MELRHSGIKVSLIEPGPIRTRFTDNVNQTQSDKPGLAISPITDEVITMRPSPYGVIAGSSSMVS
jgi:short-subunit dehydrogenase